MPPNSGAYRGAGIISTYVHWHRCAHTCEAFEALWFKIWWKETYSRMLEWEHLVGLAEPILDHFTELCARQNIDRTEIVLAPWHAPRWPTRLAPDRVKFDPNGERAAPDWTNWDRDLIDDAHYRESAWSDADHGSE